MQEIKMERGFHRGEERLLLRFHYCSDTTELVKSLKGMRWSQSLKAWHTRYGKEQAEGLIVFFRSKGIRVHYLNGTIEAPVIDIPKPEPVLHGKVSKHNRGLLDHLQTWMNSRRYSHSSIHSYLDCLEIFSRWNNNINFEEISQNDVLRFNSAYILKNGLSASYQSHFVSAIKLLFNVCSFRNLETGQLIRPNKPKRLPNVLSKQEIKALLDVTANIKHKAMLSLIYSCGLRCGELLALKPEHTDINRNLLIIKNAKGNKDRVAPLSNKVIELLKEYYKVHRPKTYVFEGWKEGMPYDERSLQLVLKQNVKKAGINKPVTLHWLRHSYATHLLEAGTNLRYIQEILGHSNPKTTQIYTHVSTQGLQNVVSPFDSL